MSKDILYTILISTYESRGKGVEYTMNNLSKIINQTYRPIQVVISDHSKNDDIENNIKLLNLNTIDLVYKRHSQDYGNIASNWNNALCYAKGSLMQYLAMDDYLCDEHSIKKVVDFFNDNSNVKWIATPCRLDPTNEVFIPRWNSCILNENTISGPSAIVLRDSLKDIKLDSTFQCLVDLDWYYRLYKIAGEPTIFNSVTWVNRIHNEQMSNTVCTIENILIEKQNLIKKYGNPIPSS